MGREYTGLFSRRFVFLIVWFAFTGILLTSTLWVLNFVRDQSDMEEAEANPEMSQIYVDYVVEPDAYVSGDALLAMGQYIQAYPEPQNVEILSGMSTQAIAYYMLNHFSAGMQVNCTHCHSLENFAADVWDDEVAMQNKMTARAHLRMTADLNQNWLAQLSALTDEKQPSGSQMTCATCHLGQARPLAWPENQQALPDDFRLPLDDLGILQVNARDDISLDTVQYDQYVMYHMNVSMGVGCTHCHNSRYFPSWDQPAKYYAEHMLLMSQHIRNNYQDVMGGQEPSCNLCHYGNILPPGAARSADVLPAVLTAAGAADDANLDADADMDTDTDVDVDADADVADEPVGFAGE